MILGLVGCITFLFRMLISAKEREIATLRESCEDRISEKDETISWLKQELRTSLRTAERSLTAAETATDVAKRVSEA